MTPTDSVKGSQEMTEQQGDRDDRDDRDDRVDGATGDDTVSVPRADTQGTRPIRLAFAAPPGSVSYGALAVQSSLSVPVWFLVLAVRGCVGDVYPCPYAPSR